MNCRIDSIDEAVEYIYSIPRFTVSNNFELGKNFLRYIGNPDRKTKIIHVAGTNGKGSVCAYINSVLREAGYNVGLFTSPHLVDIRERFVVNDEMISEKEFIEAFNDITYKLEAYNAKKKEQEKYFPTYFEYMFLICMHAFEKYDLEYCILETGLGGRLDATNTVVNKELCIITRIGLDHTEYLGDTVEKIASEKAGIMREGVATVFLAQDENVVNVYTDAYKSLNEILTDDALLGNDSNPNKMIGVIPPSGDEFIYELTSMASYQKENAALAVAACKYLKIDEKYIAVGMKKCVWPGRMEEVLNNVFVDGAHNDDGIRAFMETVLHDEHKGKRTLVFSAVRDKDYAKMMARVAGSGLFSKIITVPLETSRGLSKEELKKNIRDACSGMNIEMESFDNVTEAMNSVLKKQGTDERIYIAGSLYLVGEVKKILNETI